MDERDPEVTIEPADNGYIVRHYQRGDGKKTEGRTVRRVASTTDEALEHAGTVLGGGGRTKSSKMKSDARDGARSPDPRQLGTAGSGEESDSSPSAHAMRSPRSRGARRRPVRSRRRV